MSLSTIANKLQNVQYNPKRLNALIIRKRQPAKATGMLFASGKLIVLGVRNVQSGKDVARRIAKDLECAISCHVSFDQEAFEVANMVGTASVPYRIKLLALHDSQYVYQCQFDDDSKFRGLVFRFPRDKNGKLQTDPREMRSGSVRKCALEASKKLPHKKRSKNRIAALIFSNGKIVITGAKQEAEIQFCYEYLSQILPQFRCGMAAEQQKN